MAGHSTRLGRSGLLDAAKLIQHFCTPNMRIKLLVQAFHCFCKQDAAATGALSQKCVDDRIADELRCSMYDF
jgi:hypothetical protein